MNIDIKDIISKIRTKRINQKLYSKTVISGTRSLRTTWTRQMATDLISYHGIDINDEMEKILMNELNRKDESTL
mgnify:CR=1 FL=1